MLWQEHGKLKDCQPWGQSELSMALVQLRGVWFGWPSGAPSSWGHSESLSLFVFGYREKEMWWIARTRTLPVGGTENEFCGCIALLSPPLSLSPTHFSSLVNSVTMPYLKYLVIKCHGNSPRELFDVSLISFLTLNMLLCVLPLYLFGIYKVSGIQHLGRSLKENKIHGMWLERGSLFPLCQQLSASCTARTVTYGFAAALWSCQTEAQGGVKWGCPLTHLSLRNMWRAAAK